MNLEDHAGDILRKARIGGSVSLEQAASTLQIQPAELEQLEANGNLPPTLALDALAPTIGLSAAKLRKIAGGWRPSSVNVEGWRELRRITTERGIAVNAYVVWDEVTREAAVFDTGWDSDAIIRTIQENQLQLRHLFLTHTHEDHVAAMEPIRQKFPKIHLHTSSKNAPPQHRNRANDFISLGSLRITNRDTPGHAEDGVTYIVGNWSEDAPHVAIVGDAIFAGSIGGAPESMPLAKQKIRDQIFSLPAETLLCPGHGPFTTVAEEKANNPFF